MPQINGTNLFHFEMTEKQKTDQETFNKNVQLLKKVIRTKQTQTTGEDMYDYFINECDAVQYEPSISERKVFRYNVFFNMFSELFSDTEWPKNFENKEELILWEQNHRKKVDADKKQVDSIPDERYHLHFVFLKIEDSAIRIQLELTTRYYSISNADHEFSNSFILWRGVTDYDIENETTDFLAYAHSYISTYGIKGKLNSL